MKPIESTLNGYREFTAWMAVIPALMVFLATFLSLRVTLVSRELGAMLSVLFMVIALFLFIMSDRYVRRIVFSENLNESELGTLYRRAAYYSGLMIPAVGFVSAILVGYPDAPFTALSFMIIALSGLGSAWKRFSDKMTGKLVIPKREPDESAKKDKKGKKGKKKGKD